jgi:multicomponent Na+:H+ antiporter subunit B
MGAACVAERNDGCVPERCERAPVTAAAPPRRRYIAAAVLVGATAACLAVAFVDLPRETADLPGIARDAMAQALPDWHHTEVVSVVVYGTRGFDTFGETFLLLAAVVGVIVVCRGRERRQVFLQEERLGLREQAEARRVAGTGEDRRHPTAEHAEDVEQGEADDDYDSAIGAAQPVSTQAMTVVIRSGARTVLPLLAVAGAFLLLSPWVPGGGFPAGGVLTGVVLLSYAAFGYGAVRRVVRPDPLEAVELCGAAVIIVLAVLGLVLDGSVFANWLPLGTPKTVHAGGILQAFSASELIEVAGGLLIVVFSLLAMEREWTQEDEQAE